MITGDTVGIIARLIIGSYYVARITPEVALQKQNRLLAKAISLSLSAFA